MALHIGVEFGQHRLVLAIDLVLHETHLPQFLLGRMEFDLGVDHLALKVHDLEVRNFCYMDV